MTVDEARIAWLTADRDSEQDRWAVLYELAVPRPVMDDADGAR